MRYFKPSRIATVLLPVYILMFWVSSADCRSHKAKEYDRADMTVAVPTFSIAVKLSERAHRKLEAIHESVLVIAYFDGDPLPGQGRFNAPFRDVFLGKNEKMVDDQNVATFDSTMISKSNWNRLADKDYFVTINVVSARKASKNNLLWCGVPENRLSVFAGKTTEVSCSLIEEQSDDSKPAGAAVRALGGSAK